MIFRFLGRPFCVWGRVVCVVSKVYYLLESRPFRVGVFIQIKNGVVNGGEFVIIDVIIFSGKDLDNVLLDLRGVCPNRLKECEINRFPKKFSLERMAQPLNGLLVMEIVDTWFLNRTRQGQLRAQADIGRSLAVVRMQQSKQQGTVSVG